MNVEKRETETYVLTGCDQLDAVTVYVTNHKPGQGKLVIECFGDAWAHYWPAMGERTLQEFVLSAENAYLCGKLLDGTTQTNFDAINKRAEDRGFDLCVTDDVEVAMAATEMAECFGGDWCMDLPRCHTDEYHYMCRILDAVKGAFQLADTTSPSEAIS